MESQKAVRPSSASKRRRQPRQKPVGVELMAERRRHCRDIWTGEPLPLAEAVQWLRVMVGLDEDDPDNWGHSLLSVDAVEWSGDVATVRCTMRGAAGPVRRAIAVSMRWEEGRREVRLVG